eukprot:scaffold8536_cov36-Cyclotella_meneghiniana.AAC.11
MSALNWRQIIIETLKSDHNIKQDTDNNKNGNLTTNDSNIYCIVREMIRLVGVRHLDPGRGSREVLSPVVDAVTCELLAVFLWTAVTPCRTWHAGQSTITTPLHNNQPMLARLKTLLGYQSTHSVGHNII